MQEAAVIRRIALSEHGMRSKDGTPAMDRFMQKVRFGASECWYWVGFVDQLGYGVFKIFGENKAHRAAHILFKGPIPAGMKVMHSCDTRCCVNPDHLQVGTQAENVADMHKKGRGKSVGLSGERNPMARATNEVVSAIRIAVANGAKQIEMVRKYKLSPMTVSRIVRKVSWND